MLPAPGTERLAPCCCCLASGPIFAESVKQGHLGRSPGPPHDAADCGDRNATQGARHADFRNGGEEQLVILPTVQRGLQTALGSPGRGQRV